MAPPPHVSAFEKINSRISNHLEASLAFGLFLRSEREWAATQNPEPTEAKYRNYQRMFLTDHQIDRLAEEASEFLRKFGDEAIARKRSEILAESIDQYRATAAIGHRGFRWWGVAEAVGGAFLWTVMLIVISIVLARAEIDLIAIYQKAVGTHHQTHIPAKR